MKNNYKGLLYSLVNKPVCNEDRFLCSEFVYHILKESGIANLGISRNLVRPQSLLNIEGKMIYKGNLKEIRLPKNSLDAREIRTIIKFYHKEQRFSQNPLAALAMGMKSYH